MFCMFSVYLVCNVPVGFAVHYSQGLREVQTGDRVEYDVILTNAGGEGFTYFSLLKSNLWFYALFNSPGHLWGRPSALPLVGVQSLQRCQFVG